MGEFEGNIPVYLQVVDLFYTMIISGTLKPGEQIPPVRKLAADWGVNSNTIQKALQVLEQENITIAQVGRGRFVTESKEKLAEIRAKLITTEMERFYQKMKKFGLNTQQIQQVFTEYLQGINKERENQC